MTTLLTPEILPEISTYNYKTVRVDLVMELPIHLRTVKEDNFDIEFWKHINCVTTACIIGNGCNIPTWQQAGLSLRLTTDDKMGKFFTPVYLGKQWSKWGYQSACDNIGFYNVCHFLQMPYKHVIYLFDPTGYELTKTEPTVENAIIRIEKYILHILKRRQKDQSR